MKGKRREELEVPLTIAEKKISDLTAQWIGNAEYNAFITLTFRSGMKISYNRAEKLFGRFLYKLKARVFGRNSKRRLPLVAAIEKFDKDDLYRTRDDLNTHVHVLVRFPGDPKNFKELVAGLWKSCSSVCGDPKVYCPSTDGWFRTPDSSNFGADVAASYITKTCRINTDAILWRYVFLEI